MRSLFVGPARIALVVSSLWSVPAFGQNCTLLKQTFAIADTMNTDTSQLYVFRFSEAQLTALKGIATLEQPIGIIEKLQKTLDQDHESYKKGLFWQLDTKL